MTKCLLVNGFLEIQCTWVEPVDSMKECLVDSAIYFQPSYTFRKMCKILPLEVKQYVTLYVVYSLKVPISTLEKEDVPFRYKPFGVNKVQRCLSEGTAPVTSCWAPKWCT